MKLWFSGTTKVPVIQPAGSRISADTERYRA